MFKKKLPSIHLSEVSEEDAFGTIRKMINDEHTHIKSSAPATTGDILPIVKLCKVAEELNRYFSG